MTNVKETGEMQGFCKEWAKNKKRCLYRYCFNNKLVFQYIKSHGKVIYNQVYFN